MDVHELAKDRAIKTVFGTNIENSPTLVALKAVATAAIDAYIDTLNFNPDCACKSTCGDVLEADDDPLARCKGLKFEF